MQAVPSLVGTGTAVAAAAAGLVFGQPLDTEEVDFPRPSSTKRKLGRDHDTSRPLPAPSRPSTSTAAGGVLPTQDFPIGSLRLNDPLPNPLASHPTNSSRHSRSTTNQTTPPKNTGRGPSFTRQRDISSRPVVESNRDSISSRDSWIRRLSIRPLSQHGSARSSLIFEPQSLFSPNAGAPLVSPSSPVGQQSAPNVLVKRDNAGEVEKDSPGTLRRRMSRTRMPTLRRPATSHQRSATVQQFQHQGGFSGPPTAAPKYSLDQHTRPNDAPSAGVQAPADPRKSSSGSWTSYFHSRSSNASARRTSGRSSDGSPNGQALPNRRLSLQQGSMSRAFLTKPSLITGRRAASDPTSAAHSTRVGRAQNASDSAESTPSKRARRSISQHFTSPPSWISKTGSIRRPKRGSAEAKSGGKRHVSAPVATSEKLPQPEVKRATQEIFRSPEPREGSEAETSILRTRPRKRNSSSPLPTLSRLSSFNLDVARMGLSSSSSSGPQKQTQRLPISPSGSPAYSAFPKKRAVSGDRTSTVESSDMEARDGLSGDEEDTDFKSETMFDSFRTVASSSRMRTVESPLESMFDESPPSTAGNSKPKRWSIQEILGPALDGKNRIMEEDESISTPIRTTHLADPVEFDMHDADEAAYDSDDSSLEPLPVDRDLARLSIDEDDDDDWAREDENALSNHLSPPSSSLNSRGVSPTLRHALASISGNSMNDSNRDAMSDRPRSNIFDWCEPPNHDKFEADGHSPRPKTVHGKQEMDLRGGRSVNRKGPSAAHVRSQSVPVVPDPVDNSKPASKFGTWGLGTKTASEDWDDDFDFDGPAQPVEGKDSAARFSMIVPASIQATQPTVKAHSGQIRELSLLVNDLKRLCRHGKELGIMNGPSSTKWKDAENIIALASPDEEDSADEDDNSLSPSFDRSTVDDRFLEEGFDVQSLGNKEEPFEVPEPEMSKTTVVRERQVARRRSVFSPEDDIFGGAWPASEEHPKLDRPYTPTPDQSRRPNRDSAVISTVIEAMQQQRLIATPVKNVSPAKPSNSRLFFDTNSLQELVKRASYLRDSLSDVVRRAELLTQSPAGTPRRERHSRLTSDGSPAFTRVFTDPASASPPKNLQKSHNNNSVLNKPSLDSPRMQMMTVS